MPLEYIILRKVGNQIMKRNHTFLRLIALILAIAAVFSFSACTPKLPENSDEGNQNENNDNNTTIDTNLQVNVTVLSGTTGFSMAPLMQSHADGNAKLNYNFKVEADASNVNAALINGTVDIAALPTNAASVVYNKTGGAIQILAINTLGVLYLLDNGNNITTFEDLRGKTIAAPAQNPTFIFQYLCEKNGLKVGKVGDADADVIIDNGFTSPAELQSNVAAGNITLAVLPEPLVTITKSANADVKVAMDLTAEWNKVSPENSLVQGCIVVRKEFAEQHPAEVAAFLKEYEASVNFLMSNVSEASEMVAAQGIFAKAQVAAKAIPNCNICYMTGEEMKNAMTSFLTIMLGVQPNSIGGKLPGDDFYYGVK
jgi:NitT/TauT family transport system substrate-binding protein